MEISLVTVGKVASSLGRERKAVFFLKRVSMTQPSPEAVEAVTRIVQQALQGVTEPLVARLEQVMTEDRSQTTPTTAGMLTSGGASQAFPAISAIGGTPSGREHTSNREHSRSCQF